MRTRRAAALALALVAGAGIAFVPAPPAQAASPQKKAKKYFKKGSKLLKKKKYGKALALYEKAVALAPGVGAIHVNMARAYQGLEQCDKALLHFQAYLAVKPDAPDLDRINEERKDCVKKVGIVARLSVEVRGAAPSGGGGEGDAEGDEPPPLAVLLGSVPVGVTPLESVLLAPGPYELTAAPQGGERQTHAITLVAGEGLDVILGPDGRVPEARMRFTVLPDGMEVTLDGEALGPAPVDGSRVVAPGPHVVTVKDPEGLREPYEETVHATPGAEEVVDVELDLKAGTVVVKAPAGSLVRVGDKEVEPGARTELEPGKYAVQVATPGLRTWRGHVTVKPGETAEVLPANEAVDRPTNWTRVTAYGVAGAGLAAAGTGLFFGLGASSQFSEIKDRLDAGGDYATPAELDEISGKQTTANLLYALSAVAVGVGVALWVVADSGGAPRVRGQLDERQLGEPAGDGDEGASKADAVEPKSKAGPKGKAEPEAAPE